MKICYIGDSNSIHLQRWIRYFVERGHEVHEISDTPTGIKNVIAHPMNAWKPGKHYVPFAYTFHQLTTKRPKKTIKVIKTDILHAHYVTGYGETAANAGYHPLVISAWGSDIFLTPKKSRNLYRRTKIALEKADMVTTTAQYMRDYIIKEFGINSEKIVRIPWGIDIKIFHKNYRNEVKALKKRLNIDENMTVVISPRGMCDVYRNQDLVRAVPKIIKHHPNIVFILLRGGGSFEFENKIKLKAKRLGIEKSIRFISKVLTPQEMAIYLNCSDISLSLVPYGQFGAAVLESMACGALPIVTNIECHKERISDGKNGLFVPSGNPDSLAEKIIHALTYPELKDQFYQINKRLIDEKENWYKNAPRMERFYREVIENCTKKS